MISNGVLLALSQKYHDSKTWLEAPKECSYYVPHFKYTTCHILKCNIPCELRKRVLEVIMEVEL